MRLSGIRRQRIAIAQAILRNLALLLSDEATYALDAESERLVQDVLEHLMQQHTTIIIARRLSTEQFREGGNEGESHRIRQNTGVWG